MSTEKDQKSEKQSSGWFNKFKSLIVEEVPDEKEVASKKEVATDTVTIPSSFNFSSTINPAQTNGTFDPEIYKDLQVELEKNNLEGFDYLEFYKVRKRQESIPNITEPQKYLMAYESIQAMASNQDVTKEHLVKTADHYIDVLNNQENEFKSEMAKAMEAKVQTRLDAAQEKQASIASKTEQIAKLNAEIGELNIAIQQDHSEAQQMKDKIEGTAKNFKYTIDIAKGEIERDKQSISNYIK